MEVLDFQNLVSLPTIRIHHMYRAVNVACHNYEFPYSYFLSHIFVAFDNPYDKDQVYTRHELFSECVLVKYGFLEIGA